MSRGRTVVDLEASPMDESRGVERSVALAARRARPLVALLWLNVAAALAVVGFSWLLLDRLDRLAGGEAVSVERVARLEVLSGGALITYGILFLLTAVVWFFWLYQAYRALTLRADMSAERTPGQAVGFWFIPFVQVVVPYLVMKELWVASRDRSRGNPKIPRPWVVGLWWGTFLVAGVVDRLFYRFPAGADELQEVRVTLQGTTVEAAFMIAAGILAITMVRRITAWQVSWDQDQG